MTKNLESPQLSIFTGDQYVRKMQILRIVGLRLMLNKPAPKTRAFR